MEIVKINGMEIQVISPEERDQYLTDEDRDMDARACKAVEMAIEKAKFLKQPIARYDAATHRAYIEYPNGEKVW